MTNISKPRLAGMVCLVGGLLFLIVFVAVNSLLEPLNTLLDPATVSLVKSVCWGVVGLCLAGGSLGMLAGDAAGAGWRDALCVTGIVITLLGVASYLIGIVYTFIRLFEHYDNLLRRTVYYW